MRYRIGDETTRIQPYTGIGLTLINELTHTTKEQNQALSSK